MLDFRPEQKRRMSIRVRDRVFSDKAVDLGSKIVAAAILNGSTLAASAVCG
jgi:hypothetical protein